VAGRWAIPDQFTCEGDDISPEFSWRDAPEGTESFVLTLLDADSTRPGGFRHWVIFNIPASANRVDENVPGDPIVNGIGVQGRNDIGEIGYAGPCPCSGAHRYFARLFALNTELRVQPRLLLRGGSIRDGGAHSRSSKTARHICQEGRTGRVGFSTGRACRVSSLGRPHGDL
jgi:Raf kinase inhibitor-like YbhB/YbcL family protein